MDNRKELAREIVEHVRRGMSLGRAHRHVLKAHGLTQWPSPPTSTSPEPSPTLEPMGSPAPMPASASSQMAQTDDWRTWPDRAKTTEGFIEPEINTPDSRLGNTAGLRQQR